MAVLKDYNESAQKWEGVGAGYISNDDGTNKATPNEVKAMKDASAKIPILEGLRISVGTTQPSNTVFWLDTTP